MRAALLSLPLLFLLSACGSDPIYTATEVNIPVREKCDIDLPDKPDYNLPKVNKDAPLIVKVKAALADIELYKGYVEQLEAAAKSCSST